MGNPDDALDAAQEALIAIAKGLPRFDGRSAFSTWSYRVATNACLDELRRRRRRPLTSVDDETVEAVAMTAAGHTDATNQVVERMVLDEALAALPVEFRAPVVLRDLCNLDYAEIAEVLDLPAGTVRSRIARGRSALAAQLGGNQRPDSDRLNPST